MVALSSALVKSSFYKVSSKLSLPSFEYYNFDNCTIDAPLDFKRPNLDNISTDLVTLFRDSLTSVLPHPCK